MREFQGLAFRIHPTNRIPSKLHPSPDESRQRNDEGHVDLADVPEKDPVTSCYPRYPDPCCRLFPCPDGKVRARGQEIHRLPDHPIACVQLGA